LQAEYSLLHRWINVKFTEIILLVCFLLLGFSVGNRGSAAMDGEARQGVSRSIKKTLRCSIRLCWRHASEHRALFSIALLLYLLYRSSPRFFAFILSSSPVIICTAILLGTLLSSGIKDLPEMDEGEKAPCDNSAPKFGSHSRNGHIEAYKRFSVPAAKENIIREASFGRRDSNKHSDLDESVPLLTGGCQGDDRVDAAGGRLGKLYTSVLSTETTQQEVGMVHKDAFSGKDKEDQYDGKDTSIREVDGLMTETNHQGRMFTESQSGEVGDVSEHKAADGDGEVGKRRWGRAFSVRRRKKLAGIQIEAINPDVDNQSDYSLLSPFTRTGFDSDNAETHSLDVSVTSTAPVPDATETGPLLGADFSSSGPAKNDDSENHSIIRSLDSGTESDSIDVSDNSKAEEDGEEKRKDAGNEPGFIWTADDEKNLGYSEIERNRRLETLMSRRKSRKRMTFELDGNGVPSFRPQALAISERRLDPFGDDAEVPGSAPSILHPRKNPFDFLSEQSNDSDVVPATHNLNPRELSPAPHQDAFFKRHESFSFGRPQQQRQYVSRFKPLEECSLDEAGASRFQRQFSDRSASRLSVASECDTVSSVGGDPEHNELIRNYIRGVRESPGGLLRQDSERSGGISFGESDTLLPSAE
jgi:hypothetical protein